MNKQIRIGIIAAGIAVLAIGGGVLTLNQTESTDSNSSTSNLMDNSMMSSKLSTLMGDEFDKAFINDMVEHHTGAVAMAELVDTEAKNPKIQELAKAIITTQTKEIADMKSWAKKWGYDFQTPKQSAIDEMTAPLVNKTGDDLDKAFLAEMIGHHQSAIDMAILTNENANHSEIKTLGQQIESTQRAEIQLMKDYAMQAGYNLGTSYAKHGGGSHSM